MKRYSFILCILVIAAGVAQAQTSTTAIIVQQYTFVPVGFVAGQTVRLNISNIAGGTAVCMGNLSFVNSDGSTIKNENFTANAGQTVSYTLQTTDISSAPSVAEVRGVAKIDHQAGGVIFTPGTPPTPAPVCSALMSLEVVDANGQTQVVLTNPTLVSGITPVLISTPPAVLPQ
jgi:hypothetical protein